MRMDSGMDVLRFAGASCRALAYTTWLRCTPGDRDARLRTYLEERIRNPFVLAMLLHGMLYRKSPLPEWYEEVARGAVAKHPGHQALVWVLARRLAALQSYPELIELLQPLDLNAASDEMSLELVEMLAFAKLRSSDDS